MKKLKKTLNWSVLLIALIFMNSVQAQIDDPFFPADTIWVDADGNQVLVIDGDTIVFGEDFYIENGDTVFFDDYYGYDDSIYCPIDSFDWDDFYDDCDTIFIDDYYTFDWTVFDTLSATDCVIFEWAGDTIDWDDWYADCDTIFIDDDFDWSVLDTLSATDCYFYEFIGDSISWDDYWDDWYDDCDTIFVDDYNTFDWSVLDSISATDCVVIEWAGDTINWDDYYYDDSLYCQLIEDIFGIDCEDFDPFNYGYGYGGYDSLDCELLDSLFGIDCDDYYYNWDDWYDDCDTLVIDDYYTFDWSILDSLDPTQCIIFEWSGYTDSLGWGNYGYGYGYGGYDSLDCELLDSLFGIDCDDFYYYNDSLIAGGGYWDGEYGDCGVDGSIVVDTEFDFDYSSAVITVLDEYGNVVAILNPDADGNFNFDGLAMGTYTLVVDFAGFQFEITGFEFTGTGEVINGLVIENKPADVTSINDNFETQISLYPNPAVNFINIKIDDVQSDNANIIITNNDGRIIQNITAGGNNTNIDVSDFAAGNYNVTIITESNKTSRSFVKVR